MRYVIHVGPTKTGSTGLQAFLASNAPALEAQGAYFPTGGPGANPMNHSFLRRAPVAEVEAFARRVSTDAAGRGARTVILSGEILANLAARRWKLVLRALREHGACEDATAVYYARNIADRMLSRAAQVRKRSDGSDDLVTEFVGRTASPTAQLTALEGGLGPGKVLVRSYDAATSIAADFLAAAGLDWSDAFVETRRFNVSPDPIAGALLTALQEEYGVSGLHAAADRAGPVPTVPVARSRLLDQLMPIIEGVDVSHPLLTPFREELTAVRRPDPAVQTPFAEYVAYLGGLLRHAAAIQAARAGAAPAA